MGFYVASHSAGFFYDLLTLRLIAFFDELAVVFLSSLGLFFIGNFIVNKFILPFVTVFYPFFGKSFTISFRGGIKRWLFNTLFFIIIFILCFLMVEMVLRLTDSSLPNDLSSAKINHSSIGWVNKPLFQGKIQGENGYPITIRHNNLGLRSSSEVAPKIKTKKRILLLGDCFVYGAGLDENETIAFFLQQELGSEYEVLNGGISAFSTLQEALLFDNLSTVLSPDMVIVGMYNNDIKENVFPEASGQVKPAFLSKGFLDFKEIYQTLHLMSVKGSQEHMLLVRFNTFFEPIRKLFLEYSLLFKKLEKYQHDFFRIKDESFTHPDFLFTSREDRVTLSLYALECKLLDRFAKRMKSANSTSLFFYIPAQFEIEQERVKATFAQYYDISSGQIDLERPSRELSACAAKRNFAFFSLKESFLTQKKGLYNRYGHHWSPNATKLSAQQLTAKIRS